MWDVGGGEKVASQQSNSMESLSLYPTRTSSYKGIWVEEGPQQGPEGPGWTLTYEWLHRAMDMLVLFEARRCGEGLAAVRAGMGPGANML